MKFFCFCLLLLFLCGCSSQKKSTAPSFGGGVETVSPPPIPVAEVSVVQLRVPSVDTPPVANVVVIESKSTTRYRKYVERRTKKGWPARPKIYREITRALAIATITLVGALLVGGIVAAILGISFQFMG